MYFIGIENAIAVVGAVVVVVLLLLGPSMLIYLWSGMALLCLAIIFNSFFAASTAVYCCSLTCALIIIELGVEVMNDIRWC